MVGEYKKLLFSYSNEELGQLAFSSPSSKAFFNTYRLCDITFHQLTNNANVSTNSVEDQARLSLIQKIFYTEEPIRKIRYLNYLVPEPSDPSHRVEYIENCLQALDHWSNQSNFYKKMHLAELSKKDLCLLVDSYKSSNTSMEEQLQIPAEDIVPFLR